MHPRLVSVLVSVLAAAGLVAASTFALGVAPASASGEGIGSGRALIHIDAPTATVVKTGKNSYRMVLPPDSSGQWMGERTNAAGVTRTRVGDLTAKKLSTKWTKFRYTSKGVLSTLAWSNSAGPSTALVRLSQPKVTDAGVRFDFTSKAAIPSKLQDVSINLQRAPKGAMQRLTTNFQIADDLYIEVDVVSKFEINTRIYNNSNDNTCWTGSGAKTVKDTDAYPWTYSVTTNTCDNIQYKNYHAANSVAPANGLIVDWPDQKDVGKVSYFLVVTPPDASPFNFQHEIVTF